MVGSERGSKKDLSVDEILKLLDGELQNFEENIQQARGMVRLLKEQATGESDDE